MKMPIILRTRLKVTALVKNADSTATNIPKPCPRTQADGKHVHTGRGLGWNIFSFDEFGKTYLLVLIFSRFRWHYNRSMTSGKWSAISNPLFRQESMARSMTL